MCVRSLGVSGRVRVVVVGGGGGVYETVAQSLLCKCNTVRVVYSCIRSVGR